MEAATDRTTPPRSERVGGALVLSLRFELRQGGWRVEVSRVDSGQKRGGLWLTLSGVHGGPGPMSADDLDLPPPVKVGFSGSRALGPGAESEWVALASDAIREILAQVDDHASGLGRPVSGVSQIAIGGDTAFALACKARRIPLQVFLPQHRDAYLHAGSDFSDPQRAAAVSLLDDHDLVVEERVVSHAASRDDRFLDAHHAILGESDVVIVVRRHGAVPRGPAGAQSFLDLAIARGLPCCEIELPQQLGEAPRVQWHRPLADLDSSQVGSWLSVPEGSDPCKALKARASAVADEKQAWFARGALVVTLSHVCATFIALLVILTKYPLSYMLLPLEVVLLVGGMWTHGFLHREHVVRRWAYARLVAELARSVLARRAIHDCLEHLYRLPLPDRLQPTLRAIELDHLWRTRGVDADWRAARDRYVDDRIVSPTHGQLPYYQSARDRAERSLFRANKVFYFFGSTAILATGTKFSLYLTMGKGSSLEPVLGALAILGPVVAVAAVALAAAYDLEARANTFGRMAEFLDRQREQLLGATSEREFRHHVRVTEERLVGETVSWFWRRSYVGIT